MKKILSLFMSMVMLISITAGLNLTANAEVLSGNCGAYGSTVRYSLDTSTGVLTISGTGDMCNFSSTSNEPWYSNRSSVKTVTISSGVTSIGDYAFDYCYSLTSITIPDSVTRIGDFAFDNCYRLTSVTIPNSVTSIGNRAFYNCSSLISVTIPNCVTSIGNNAFFCCSSLTNVTIPDSVTSIGVCAFSGCSSLTSITVDSNNQYYSSQGDVLFNKDKTTLIQYLAGNARTSYEIPNSVTSLGDGAFYGCSSLTSITIPDSVTSISDWAFGSCNSLTSVTIPDSVTSIGDYAFDSCSSLTGITIPNSVTSIGYSVFYRCSGLTSITIPDSVTRIEDYAFKLCSSLTDVYYSGTIEQWKKISIGSNNSCLTNATIHYHEHTYTDVITPPTCTKQGYTTHTCTVCGDSYVDNYTDKLGHSFTNYESDNNATCTSDGTKTAKCDRCDITDTITDEGTKLGHSFTNYVSDNNATCTSDGTKTAKCDRCDARDTITIVGTALGHSFTNYVSDNNATCTADGTKTAKCDRCDETDTVVDVDSKGHNYAPVVTEPTCTEQGYTTYTCQRCSDSYIADYTEKLGHSFTNYESDNNATCTEDGTKTAKCDRCDARDTITIVGTALGHSFNDGKNCAVCGEVNPNYVEPTPIPTPQPTTTTQPTTTAPVQPTTQAQQEVTAEKEATTKPASVKVGKTVYKADKNGDYVSTKVKKPAVSKATNAKKSIKITWKKVDAVSGYEVEYSIDKKFNKNVKTATVKGNKAKNPSVTLKNLKSNKTYYVRIRTYKTTKVNGKSTKVYSSWSKVKSVKTK